MDRFTALKTYCAVVQANSFAKAALRIGLSRSAVSKNISELEAYLGVTLIRRTTRGISLTESGEAYYARIQPLLTQMQDADDLARQFGSEPCGSLRVAAPMSLGLQCVMPLIPAFVRYYPGIALDLVLSDDKVNLLSDSFDVAIRGSSKPLSDSTTVVRSIGSFDHVLCAAPGYLDQAPSLLSPQDLFLHHCLVYSGAGQPAQWDFVHAGEQCSMTVKAAFSCNNSLALRHAALHGQGIVRIPEVFVRKELAAGSLCRVLEQWCCPKLDLWVMYPQAHFMPQRLRVFIDFLARNYNQLENTDHDPDPLSLPVTR